ncbi:hypothetical protein [Bernardetia litoralis]|uniref:hypothetical protein n=1 Tax=Bernardetia litoralis TaxID=999 RepID=UPI0002E3D69E|nr:hypothetical protein [Bernardetia litoralis]
MIAPSYSFAVPISSSNSHNEQKMSSRLSSFLDAHDSITPEMKEKAIQKIIDFDKNFKITTTNEAKTVRRLFFAVQETFLKEYVLYSSFFQTIDDGKFDCLTGSVLYAVFLEEIKRKGNFDYIYQIVQMPTHVFVKIELSDKSEIIFESTGFDKGFIATPKGIDFYLQQQIKKVQEETQSESVILLNNQKLNNLVTLEAASALLYFNQGVLFFNQRKFGKSLKMAKNAFFYHKNEAFYDLIRLSLQELLKNNIISEKEYTLNIKNTDMVNN